MRKFFLCLPLAMICATPILAQNSGSSASPQALRAIGVVTEIQAGSFKLRTDAGPDVLVMLGEGVSFLRVPPGATSLNTAAKITLSEISTGDRVLVRGRASEDQKSLVAATVIVMTKSDLASAREAERLDWQRRGIRGTVKSVNPETRELTIEIPTESPGSRGSTHLVVLTLTGSATLLRYAPDSVKFADAKPSTFEQIKVGDQLRALGTKTPDGNRFAAEKIVSGTFRTLAVTVVSVDAQSHTISATEIESGQPILVRTNADSKAIRLSPTAARLLAALNAGGSQEGKGATKATTDQPSNIDQELERAPALDFAELKPGGSLIVVTAEGTKQSEVTAVNIFAGVEPILAGRPKGSDQAVFGPWTLGKGGGEGGP